MKDKLTLLLIFFSINVFGQQVLFKNELVDTILIRSHRSAFQFDEKGTTKGQAEYLEIVYKKERQEYIIDRYYQDKYNRHIRPDTIKIEKKYYTDSQGKIMANDKLQKLINSINTVKKNNESTDIIPLLNISKVITLRRIKKVAKKDKADWQFSLIYTTRKENRKIEKDCQSIDTFKVYLAERFDTIGTVVTDYSNDLTVWVVTDKNEYSIKGEYPNPFKQPWWYRKNGIFIKPIINFSINLALYDILPEKFFLKEKNSKDALVDDYIKWYLERRDIIILSP